MSLVTVTVTDGVATLTLNNPDERNTLTAPMVEEIIAAMDKIEGDPNIGALVVTGTAPAFCAGANLGNLAEATGENVAEMVMDGREHEVCMYLRMRVNEAVEREVPGLAESLWMRDVEESQQAAAEYAADQD
jgi:enoyl-CoA hydratase/carnithine racemase